MKLPGTGNLAMTGGLILSAVMLVMQGLLLVWLSIERWDTSYSFMQLSTKISANEDLHTKLTLERNNLLAPYRLKALAREYGLEPAGMGQIRRLPR